MTEEVINQKALQRLLGAVGDDPEFLQELIEEFHNGAPELVEKMQRAAAAGDLDGLRISAHTLKSNSREFGATTLGVLCEKLEHDCRHGNVIEPDARIAEILREVDTAKAALARIQLASE